MRQTTWKNLPEDELVRRLFDGRVVLGVVLPLDEESTDGPRSRVICRAPVAEHLVDVPVQPLDAALGLGVTRSSMHDDAFRPDGFDVFDDFEHELHRKVGKCSVVPACMHGGEWGGAHGGG